MDMLTANSISDGNRFLLIHLMEQLPLQLTKLVPIVILKRFNIPIDQELDNEANINGDIKDITNEKKLELELYRILVGIKGLFINHVH
ncbi:6667_t:CDS:2 [Entrophospora sp. SA101]|nr:5762_t:CDS:2 [Entrophospora sp. SA101]CAJ0650626.1 6667_t:CDS:2 [Entrophospora sp. SA101]CAJ0851425.1 4901_t:CDS:2 [Entrophospora sp. SA101]CAJ0893090.1 5536_t:CDS:2 [Entrophospora sp. SA101]CAJ0903316.1 8628_t:CDS:2 [Entrophospora sp. SA101]